MAHFEICAAVTTCNSGSCLFSRLPPCSPTHHRSASPDHLHTPSAVSSDEGPYSKGSKESGMTDQSHPSHRRSFSGTMPSKLTPCKSVFLLCLIHATLPNSCTSSQRGIILFEGRLFFCFFYLRVHAGPCFFSAVFCLMLLCFECSDKVEKNACAAHLSFALNHSLKTS